MKFKKDITLLSHTLQTAIIGLFNEANDNHNLLSHIVLILKYYIPISREKRTLKIDILVANLIKVREREKQISICTISKREAYKKVVHCRYNFLFLIFCLFYLFVCFFNYFFACFFIYICFFQLLLLIVRQYKFVFGKNSNNEKEIRKLVNRQVKITQQGVCQVMAISKIIIDQQQLI